MQVRLIAITKPVGVLDGKTAEQLIVYAARVSNPNNQDNMDTGDKLLKYCLAHNHVSIFEQADMSVEIITSRAISAQILRHRSFCFQEFSQRYAAATSFESYEARRQDGKNRQNSIDDMPQYDKEWFENAQTETMVRSNDLYEGALARGIAKEQARFLLPLSIQTKLYMKGSCRSWIHYLDVRCDESTQKEHRDVANKIKEIFCEQFPVIAKAKGWIE